MIMLLLCHVVIFGNRPVIIPSVYRLEDAIGTSSGLILPSAKQLEQMLLKLSFNLWEQCQS